LKKVPSARFLQNTINHCERRRREQGIYKA
jgi:hypothetical protein